MPAVALEGLGADGASFDIKASLANSRTGRLALWIVPRVPLKGEGNTVLSTTGEPGTLKGTNPSVTATSPLTLWGSACHALFSALEPKQ